jgi:hypothetical protein
LKIDTEQNQTKDQKNIYLPPVAKRSSVENAEQNPNKTPGKKKLARDSRKG